MNKLDEIRFLASKRKTNNVDIEKEIKKKFGDISTYKYRKDVNKIKPGTIIRHVDQNLKKISPSGIIYEVIYHDPNEKNKIVKSLKIFNDGLKMFWKINVVKYHIFQPTGSNSDMALLKSIFSTMGGNLLDDYKINEEYNDDDFLREQIDIYNNDNK